MTPATPNTAAALLPGDIIRTHAAVRIAQLLKLATTWQAAVLLAPVGRDAAAHLCNIAGLKRKLEGLLELANLARIHYGEPPAADVETAIDQANRQIDDILVALCTARAVHVLVDHLGANTSSAAHRRVAMQLTGMA